MIAVATDQYERTGWTTVPGLFTADECAAIGAACDARQWPRVGPGLAGWLADPRWTAVVAPLFGGEVHCVREQLVTKAPRAEHVVPWHQDAAYARVRGPFLTCFLALEPITPDNGCLWVDGGSHHRGPLEHVAAGYLLEIADPVGAAGHAVTLGTGDALVFSSLTAHRSLGNRTAGTRRAWMVQFAPSSTSLDG